MTEIHYPSSGLASKIYTCETYSTVKEVEDWTTALREIPELCLFKVIFEDEKVPHDKWVEQVKEYMKSHKKGFDYSEKKVPKVIKREQICLKSKKIKSFLTIDTIDGKDVPFESIKFIIFNEIMYTK